MKIKKWWIVIGGVLGIISAGISFVIHAIANSFNNTYIKEETQKINGEKESIYEEISDIDSANDTNINKVLDD